MQITCFSGFSKKPNSTKQPLSGTVVTVTLKEPTSIMHPVFILSSYSLSYNYIAWGSRYYYVDDIVIVHNDVAEYHCSFDALATFKTDIGTSSQYIARAADSYDQDIIDFQYPTKTKPTFNSYPFAGSLVTSINSTGTYVLGVKSSGSSTGLTFYAIDQTNMTYLMNFMFSDNWMSATDISTDLQKLLCDPMDFISCCYWFPFTLASAFTDQIYFGYFPSPANGAVISESDRIQILYDTVTIGTHPQAATRGRFLNGAPFTRIMASIYGFGRIPLDANLCITSQTIGAYIRVDLFTGVAELSLASGGGDLAKVTTMFGVPIQLSQVTQDIIKPITQALGAATSFAAGDVFGTLTGIGSAILSGLSPQVQTTGSFGSKIAFEETPHIFCEWYSLADEDNTTIGRPLCKQDQISLHTGYMKCVNVDFDTTASPEEKQSIIQTMEGGFFYE